MIDYDTSRYPLVFATWAGDSDKAEVLAFNRWLEELMARALRQGDQIIVINDSTHSGRMPSDARKSMTDAMNHRAAELNDTLIVTYAVVTSTVVRGVLTAIGWMAKDMKKVKICSSLAEAVERSEAAFVRAGVELPAPQRAQERRV